jgi:calcium-dependent protein kinase
VYCAPEILKKQKAYNEKCDLWSIGVMIYFFLTHKYPFDGDTDAKTMRLILNSRTYPTKRKYLKIHTILDLDDAHVSDKAKALISHLLERDVDKRYSAQQALADPWFQDCDHCENN